MQKLTGILLLSAGWLHAITGVGSVTITDTSGSAQNGRPTTIHRTFAQGDIANYPQPNGAGVGPMWQADVHSRWRDGTQTCSITNVSNTTPIQLTLSGCTGDGFHPTDIVTVTGSGAGVNGTWKIETSGNNGLLVALLTSQAAGALNNGTVTGPAAGSVKDADISWFQTLAANGSDTIAFVNSTNPSSSGDAASTVAASQNTIAGLQQLPWAYTATINGSDVITGVTAVPWDGDIEFTANASTVTADAQTMLSALSIGTNQVRYWRQGPVTTEAYIEDRTSARSQDLAIPGSVACGAQNPCKSMHPFFMATIWNNVNAVQVESIAENVWTDKLQPLTYSVNVKTGSPLVSQYTHASFTQLAGGRWHKTFWSGTAPGTIAVDYNMGYLVSSKILPNYDTKSAFYSINVDASEINFLLTGIGGTGSPIKFTWNASDKGDLGGFGMYAPHFGDTGGRAEIGWMERWNSDFLFSMQTPANYNTLWPVVMGNADVSGNVPIHYRESTSSGGPQLCPSTRCYDQFGTVDAFGLPVSVSARSTWSSIYSNGNPAVGADAVTPVSNYLCNGNGNDGLKIQGCAFSVSSTSTNTVGLGTLSFVIPSGWTVWPGETLQIFAQGTGGATWVQGPVTSQSGTTITINATSINGTGTFSGWDINDSQGFSVDFAHQAAFGFVPYLLTGEPYWLEEMYQWMHLDTANSGSGLGVFGHDGKFGIVQEVAMQLRGVDWATRNIDNAGFLGADGDPQKDYALEKLQYNLQMREGQYNITSGSYFDSHAGSAWYDGFHTFGLGTGFADANPLKTPVQQSFASNDCNANPGENDATVTCAGRSAFQVLMAELVFGHIGEHLPAESPISDFMSAWHIGHILNPSAIPYDIITYAEPVTRRSDGHYFQTWAEQTTGYLSSWKSTYDTNKYPVTDINGSPGFSPTDEDFGYIALVGPAAAYAYSRTTADGTGAAAWSWWASTLTSAQVNGLLAHMNENPKWAIVPRSLAVSSCAISPISESPSTVGQPISWLFTQSNCGAGPFTWSNSGTALPTGLSMCPAVGTSCTITGTVSAAGTFTPTIRVTDGGSNTATDPLSLTVNNPPSITTTSPLPSATQGVAYSQSLATTAGTGAVTCRLSTGSLTGSGLSLSSACLISGTPATPANYSFSVIPTDVNNIDGSASAFTLQVLSAGQTGGTVVNRVIFSGTIH